MRKLFVLLGIAALVAVLGIVPAAAQGGLDPTAEPNFMNVSLGAGFLPDPDVVGVVSGGDQDVSTLNLAPECRGFAATAPDVRLNWTGQAEVLRLFAMSDDDTTLIVNTPAGEWLCNDDYAGLDPLVEILTPAEGTYTIWVGSYSADEFTPAYLFITEGPMSQPGAIQSTIAGVFAGAASGASASGGAIDPTLTANFGTVDLAAGFAPDPHTVEIVSGGGIDLSTAAADCRGYATSNPDYQVNWTGSAATLRLYFVGEGDATLAVMAPDGTLLCNDDFPGGFNPLVDVTNPAAGTYSVWVGSFARDNFVPGMLYVTTNTTLDPTKPQ